MTFVMARTAAKRPTLQHILHDDSFTLTLCGVTARGWSRVYMDDPIPILLCRRCNTSKENSR